MTQRGSNRSANFSLFYQDLCCVSATCHYAFAAPFCGGNLRPASPSATRCQSRALSVL